MWPPSEAPMWPPQEWGNPEDLMAQLQGMWI
jgi:hypothetical protein